MSQLGMIQQAHRERTVKKFREEFPAYERIKYEVHKNSDNSGLCKKAKRFALTPEEIVSDEEVISYIDETRKTIEIRDPYISAVISERNLEGRLKIKYRFELAYGEKTPIKRRPELKIPRF